MKKVSIHVYKDKIKRKNFLKTELKYIVLKSVFQNFQADNIVRTAALKKIIFIKKKSSISKQNNVCLITGRYGGVYKQYNLSRHMIKQTAKYNLLHNTKIKSW